MEGRVPKYLFVTTEKTFLYLHALKRTIARPCTPSLHPIVDTFMYTTSSLSADKVIFVGRLVEAGDVVSPLAGAELVCTWPLPTTLLSNIAV